MVQSCHAALEAGLSFKNPSDIPNSLIVIGLSNKHELEKAIRYCELKNIQIKIFIEPDWNYGLTAFATEPILESDRHIFKKYQLWKGDKHA